MDDTSAHDPTGNVEAVRRLLAGAGLAMAPDEFERMVRVYPLLRAQADGLFAPEFAGVDFGLGFDPTVGFN